MVMGAQQEVVCRTTATKKDQQDCKQGTQAAPGARVAPTSAAALALALAPCALLGRYVHAAGLAFYRLKLVRAASRASLFGE